MIFVLGMQSSWAAQIKVVVRYDDYSSYSQSPSRLDLERRLFGMIGSLKGSTLVGVIPHPGIEHPVTTEAARALPLALSREKLDLLVAHAKGGTAVVALHGFNHKPNRLGRSPSEFAGVPEASQRLLLKAARQSLEAATGSVIDTFVPPFNTYDSATLAALDATGFKLISAALSQTAVAGQSLRYLPGTVYPGFLMKAVQYARAHGDGDALIVVTMHPYDFTESGENLAEFRKGGQVALDPFLRELKELYDTGQIVIASATDLSSSGEDLSAARYAANQRLASNWVTRYRLLPHFLGLYAMDSLYYTQASATRMYYVLVATAVLLYGGLMLSVLALTASLVRRIQGRRPIRSGNT